MTKIDIFSGFLGAGKTTLIRKLISEAFKGEKLVLIENEFGEIAIDGGFLQDAGIEITEMSQGCICCSLVGDFGKALRQVLETYHPDRILIEPSGVGKLSDVIRAVQNLHMEDVTLNSFTTVADANKCKMYMKNFGEFYNDQIEHANSIILSRTDGIKPEKLEACVALLREHNQNATINSVGTAEYLIDGASSYEAIWAQPKPASGDLHLISYEKREGVAYVSVENDGGEAAISLPIYNYGNYYADDESGAPFAITSGENMRIVLTIPAGYTGTIHVRYHAPGYWRAFEALSAVSLLGVIGCGAFARRKRRTPATV